MLIGREHPTRPSRPSAIFSSSWDALFHPGLYMFFGSARNTGKISLRHVTVGYFSLWACFRLRNGAPVQHLARATGSMPPLVLASLRLLTVERLSSSWSGFSLSGAASKRNRRRSGLSVFSASLAGRAWSEPDPWPFSGNRRFSRCTFCVFPWPPPALLYWRVTGEELSAPVSPTDSPAQWNSF